ncbi:MAG TPA: DNA recombination protein RmuC [Fimbriimonadaceae bacterium]|nr:DNA recombination protein RmuC [Fimbriimonadaceae bacterium]HRJ95537.1 DNA recombination protein RmuC [Fimbriimonadaceae bacterium]
MNTADITIVVLGALSLALAAVAAFLFKARSDADTSHRTEVESLNTKLNEAAKSVGQAEELRNEKAAVEGQLLSAQSEINRLTDELATAKAEREAAESAAASLIEKEKEACEAILEAKQNELEAKDVQIENLNQFIEKASETLGTQFKALSQETLKDVSAQFEKAAKQVIERNSETTTKNVALHKQEIENLLKPVGLTLEQLNQQVKDTNEKRGEAEAVLMDRIKEFAGANEKLANALNKPVIRGSFAETKLETLLEAAGLVKGENFELQAQVKDGNQTRIVDALVHMAQGKKLVIDSKNLLVPFVEYANASDEDRAARLADFQKAFRSTLKDLSVKDYSKHWEGIDAVIMFLPDEGMYMAAIESDRQLIATMFEQRVFTVSPVSLLPILKSVAYILGLEKQNKDTLTIVDAGRALYESLGVILSKVKTLGDKLEDGVEAYNGVIASFEGNVLPKTRQLRQLGIRRGAEHKVIRPLDVQRRDFKERTVRDLSGQGQLALAAVDSDGFEDDEEGEVAQ